MSLKTNNLKVTNTGAVSAHLSDTESNIHGVGIWKLHVLIVPDGRFWFAQGFEIDYSVQGDTVEDAKDKFSKGLRASIHHHLEIFGRIDGLQRVVPNEIWSDLWKAKARAKLTYSCVSIHEIVPDDSVELLPFDGIEYAVESPELAAA
jgi:hypothetical protein